MELNYLGLIAAVGTFLGIWWGHVVVRVIEAKVEKLWPPMLIAILLGTAFEITAARTQNIGLSAFCGIFGMTLLWDAFEFYRQQKRVKYGHAPATPDNPRHAQILADYPEATTVDLLKNSPRGREYSAEEVVAMKARVE